MTGQGMADLGSSAIGMLRNAKRRVCACGHLLSKKVGGTQTRGLVRQVWLFGVLIDVQKGQATEGADWTYMEKQFNTWVRETILQIEIVILCEFNDPCERILFVNWKLCVKLTLYVNRLQVKWALEVEWQFKTQDLHFTCISATMDTSLACTVW